VALLRVGIICHVGYIIPLAERLSLDTIARLVRAADQRFSTAEVLSRIPKRLAALYLYGYCAEIWISAAYYRSAGFRPNEPISRDTRHRRMAQARQLRLDSGVFLMDSDPHPLIGWARFLQWQRSATPEKQLNRVVQAVKWIRDNHEKF